MDRDELLTRCRNYHEIFLQHQSAAMKMLSRQTILDCGHRLGLANRKTLTMGTTGEMTLIFDLAVYTSLLPGRSRALDRYRKSAKFSAESDEARILDAICHSRFALWKIEGLHETAGTIVRDPARQQNAWFIDVVLPDRPLPEGAYLAMRLCEPDGTFSLPCGSVVPVTSDMLDEIVAEIATYIPRTPPEKVMDDPRFAAIVYRTAIQSGVYATAEDEDILPILEELSSRGG
ncbi:MAG TPA: hypothetical protein VGD08_01715 [Stellaceae bacterium]